MEETAPMIDRRFVLLDALGSGGMGRVYRAYDRERESVVALKVLHEAGGEGRDHPLAGEFETWARLRHRHIVRALALGRARRGPLPPGTPYLVLEHVEGRPAHRALRPGACPERTLVSLADAVLDALSHVHAEGLVHRDLKPGNVLVGARGGTPFPAKLTDFGLAEAVGLRTEPGRVSGSLPYVAPETILGGPVDGRADLYALGLLLYYLAAGKLPFPSSDAAGVVRWHLCGDAADPRDARAPVSERFARFVRRMTERDPRLRPRSASAARRMLLPDRGATPGPSARPSAERATLRLALDAVRLGAWRVLDLPRGREAARLRLDETCALADLHGLTVHRVRCGEAGPRWSLGGIVARMLADRGPRARATAERLGLVPALPIEFLGDLPLWSRARRSAGSATDGGAAAVAALVEEACAAGPIVLAFDPGATADTLVADLMDRLVARAGERRGIPGSSWGGLLVAGQATVRSAEDRAAS